MGTSISVRPINSILFLSGSDGGEPPAPFRGRMIQSTSSCISFGCYPEQEGPTEILIGCAGAVAVAGKKPAFDGELVTLDGHILLSTAELETVYETQTPSVRARVRIWFSHPKWPEQVTIDLS